MRCSELSNLFVKGTCLHELNRKSVVQDYVCDGCGSSCGVLTDASGTISDGSGDSEYANDADCIWLIAPPGATSVSITFDAFETEAGFDAVSIYECSSIECESMLLLEIFSGLYELPPTIQSSTGFLQVHFISDESGTAPGFTASWTSSYPVCVS